MCELSLQTEVSGKQTNTLTASHQPKRCRAVKPWPNADNTIRAILSTLCYSLLIRFGPPPMTTSDPCVIKKKKKSFFQILLAAILDGPKTIGLGHWFQLLKASYSHLRLRLMLQWIETLVINWIHLDECWHGNKRHRLPKQPMRWRTCTSSGKDHSKTIGLGRRPWGDDRWSCYMAYFGRS